MMDCTTRTLKQVLGTALLGALLFFAQGAGAVSGAISSTTNPVYDGANYCLNGNDPDGDGVVNCNLYTAKEYVWLSGLPVTASLGAGTYFFAVLEPGGQGGNDNPNDGTPKNLSDDYDAYTNRTFTVDGNGVIGYAGTHVLDSNKLRLFPYADTANPGGVYILAVCSLAKGYPVNPRDCKYDAFKIRTADNITITACKWNDVDADGIQGDAATEPPIPNWPITGIGVIGDAGEGLTQFTGQNGCTYFAAKPNAAVELEEGTLGAGWTQTAPKPVTGATQDGVTYDVLDDSNGGPKKYVVSIPAGTEQAPNLTKDVTFWFGNYNAACVPAEKCGEPPGLSIAKTAENKTTWTISKSVDKTQINIAAGGSATFNYTVAVGFDAASAKAVKGAITLTNGSPADIDVASLTDSLTDATCTIESPPTLVSAGTSVEVKYSCVMATGPASGTNSATVTWTSFDGGSATATKAVDVIDECVAVSDSYGGSLGNVCNDSTSNPKSFQYSRTESGVAGTCTSYGNTATATTNDTGDAVTSSKDVKVCVGSDLTVSKTAVPSFKRTYSWDIAKSVDKTLVKQVGGTATFNYTVTASQTGFTDSDWKVTGKITVTNPNDWQAVTVNVTDAIDNGGTCTVTGGTNASVPAGGSKDFDYTCTYASAPSPAAFTNTATATWDAAASFTPSGTASGSKSGSFGGPTTTVNKTVTVTDTFDGTTTTLGTVTATDTQPYASKAFTYSRTITVPTWSCVDYSNTAKIVETGQTASQKVTVCGPVKTGALTMGFWSNKNGQAIITGGASTAGVCNSGTWLRQFAPFQDLSATATCAQVGSWFLAIKTSADASGSSMNAMLKAQMLATALDVYFSDPALGGNKINAPAPIGGVSVDLTKICTDLSCTTYQDSSSVFGGTPKTVLEMLSYAASQSNVGGSTWYGNVKSTQELAKDAFDAINNQKVFAP